MDIPIGSTGAAAGNRRQDRIRRADQGSRGAVGDRQVSESPAHARPPPLRHGRDAAALTGAVEPHRSLTAREAIVICGDSPRMRPGLLGGADRPPPPRSQAPDFFATYRRLRELRGLHRVEFGRAVRHAHFRVLAQFRKFGGDVEGLRRGRFGTTMADEAYSALQAQARQADEDGDLDRADGIRTALETISRQAAEALRKLSTQVGLAPAPATHPSRREPLHQPIAPTIRGLVPVAGWPETGGFSGPPERSSRQQPGPSRPARSRTPVAGMVSTPAGTDPVPAPPGPGTRVVPTQAATIQRPTTGESAPRQGSAVPRCDGPGSTDSASSPGSATETQDFVSSYRRLRELHRYYLKLSMREVAGDFKRGIDRVHSRVLVQFEKSGGDIRNLATPRLHPTKADQAYAEMRAKARKADGDGDFTLALAVREALKQIDELAARELRELSTQHGVAPIPCDQAPPQRTAPAPAARHFDWTFAFRRLHGLKRHFSKMGSTSAREDFEYAVKRIDSLVSHRFRRFGGKREDLPGRVSDPALKPEKLYRALKEMAARASESGDADRGRDISESIAELESRILKELYRLEKKHGSLDDLAVQADLPRQPARTTEPGEAGRQPTGEPLQTAPVTTVSAGAALEDAFIAPSWLEDDFAVERALIAGRLPPGFDATPLIVEAGTFEQFGLGAELAAGRLPMQAIDTLIEGFRATDEEGGNTLFIDYLESLKENLERALRAAYPERAEPQWLDLVRKLEVRRDEPAASGAVAPLQPPRTTERDAG